MMINAILLIALTPAIALIDNWCALEGGYYYVFEVSGEPFPACATQTTIYGAGVASTWKDYDKTVRFADIHGMEAAVILVVYDEKDMARVRELRKRIDVEIIDRIE